MNFYVKAVCCCAVFLAMVSESQAQINLKAASINFRTYDTPNSTTYHYGDLVLDGGSSGSGWGWFTCNKLNTYGQSNLMGTTTIWSGLNVVSGTKNFIQPHPTDTTKVIKYIAIEAGEAMTMARGTATTSGGSAVVNLPEHFALVTSDDAPLTVLLTPENAPVLLYTAAKTRDKISVVMKPADFTEYGDASFAWQVSGVRDGYENEEIICDADSLLSGKINDTAVSGKRSKINGWAAKMQHKVAEREAVRAKKK